MMGGLSASMSRVWETMASASKPSLPIAPSSLAVVASSLSGSLSYVAKLH